jgi:hypothetical protein
MALMEKEPFRVRCRIMRIDMPDGIIQDWDDRFGVKTDLRGLWLLSTTAENECSD